MSKPLMIHDLRGMFGDVRDQGVRPTCLAFAVSDCHAALRAGWDPLSAEFVFYHAQRRASLPPTEGALLLHILDALRDDGQPPEALWPYLAILPADLSHWGPPAVTVRYFRKSARGPGSFDEIVDNLGNGLPTVVVLHMGEAFYDPQNGVISGYPGEKDVTRHAVIAVGAGTIGGQRALLVRNSWGTSWGLNGYAWVTENYVSLRLRRIAVLKEEVGVSAHQNAA